jgi:RNA polymerase sigma-70 factor (family 1)
MRSRYIKDQLFPENITKHPQLDFAFRLLPEMAKECKDPFSSSGSNPDFVLLRHNSQMAIYSNLSDTDLLLLIRDGREAAFTEIYNRYWERLIATGYYYTREKEAAEEIVHDVLMGLWLRRDNLQIQSLPAYLGTAVKFSIFKAMARNKRRKELLARHSIIQETHNETEQQLDARFLEEYLQGIVEQLPEKARMVFVYSRADALSVKEIAKKMDLSSKSVEYPMTKALKTIRDFIRKMSVFVLSGFL